MRESTDAAGDRASGAEITVNPRRATSQKRAIAAMQSVRVG
jgi:hypothetical protein